MIATCAGARAELTHTVGSADRADAWANDLPVLATPVLLWLAEITCMRVIEQDVPAGWMTVGCAHRSAEHRAATPSGWTVTVTATLTRSDGRTLSFDVRAHDGEELVYTGVHERAAVERDRFLQRLERKAGRVPA